MTAIQPQQGSKIADAANQIPLFFHGITFGLIPRMSLPVFIDIIALLVWIVVSTLPLAEVAPIRYLLAGYFVLGLLRFPSQLWPVVIRCWPIFLVPALTFASAAWSPIAGEAIRQGVMMTLTALFGIYFAARLSARQIIFGYFAIETVAMVVTYMGYLGSLGTLYAVFNQKNHLAIHMFILLCGAMVYIFDKHSHAPIRWLAVVLAGLASWLIIATESATTIAFLILAIMAFAGHALVWEPARRVANMRMMIFIIMTAIVCILLYAVVAVGSVDLYARFLEASGKDSTLTGRTYLWDHARRIMDEHPWTGLGTNAFWRPEIGAANSITTYFHYERFTKFSFHNSYLEIGVQLGYPGMYMLIFTAAWALYRNVRNWFMDQSITSAFFLVLAILVIIRSNTEADLAGVFGPTLILLYVGAAREVKKVVRPGRAAPPPLARRIHAHDAAR